MSSCLFQGGVVEQPRTDAGMGRHRHNGGISDKSTFRATVAYLRPKLAPACWHKNPVNMPRRQHSNQSLRVETTPRCPTQHVGAASSGAQTKRQRLVPRWRRNSLLQTGGRIGSVGRGGHTRVCIGSVSPVRLRRPLFVTHLCAAGDAPRET